MKRSGFDDLVHITLGVRLPRDAAPRKICDLKPAYGRLFSDELVGFDYWGHCDLDVIWGALQEVLQTWSVDWCDVVSPRAGRLAGHCTLFRNAAPTVDLFASVPEFWDALALPDTVMFDEIAMTEAVAAAARSGRLTVYWPRFVLEDEFRKVLRRFPETWHWKRGTGLTDTRTSTAVLYLHFTDWQRGLSGLQLPPWPALTELWPRPRDRWLYK